MGPAGVLSMTVRGTDELKYWILGFGPHVEVLRPEGAARHEVGRFAHRRRSAVCAGGNRAAAAGGGSAADARAPRRDMVCPGKRWVAITPAERAASQSVWARRPREECHEESERAALCGLGPCLIMAGDAVAPSRARSSCGPPWPDRDKLTALNGGKAPDQQATLGDHAGAVDGQQKRAARKTQESTVYVSGTKVRMDTPIEKNKDSYAIVDTDKKPEPGSLCRPRSATSNGRSPTPRPHDGEDGAAREGDEGAHGDLAARAACSGRGRC